MERIQKINNERPIQIKRNEVSLHILEKCSEYMNIIQNAQLMSYLGLIITHPTDLFSMGINHKIS